MAPQSTRTASKYEAVVPVDDAGTNGRDVKISLQPAMRHMVEWQDTIVATVHGTRVKLPPGSCCLYEFPLVKGIGSTASVRSRRRLTDAQIELLSSVLVPTLTDIMTTEVVEERAAHAKLRMRLTLSGVQHLEEAESDVLHSVRDDVGASALHALLVANNAASIALALRLCEKEPRMLGELHEGQPFAGESALHVLAVNSREDALCTCVRIAAEKLDPAVASRLFTAQTLGDFFAGPPMNSFGSTALSFATAFGLKRAASALCTVDPDLAKNYCLRTGFLPIHVAVAQESTAMFDFWLGASDAPSTSATEAAAAAGLEELGSLKEEGDHVAPASSKTENGAAVAPAEAAAGDDAAGSASGGGGRNAGGADATQKSPSRVEFLAGDVGDVVELSGMGPLAPIGLPEAVRATGVEVTGLGRMPGFAKGLTPLQLAARLGRQETFAAILKRSMQPQWRWGPVSEYKIYLNDIDSAGSGAYTVMESVCSLDARPETRAMLLETFMSGFLFALFRQKFMRFGVGMHALRLALHFACLGSLVGLGLGSWAEPDPTCVAMLLLTMGVSLEEMLRETVLLWCKYSPSMNLCELLRQIVRQLSAHQVFSTLAAFALTLAALSVIWGWRDEAILLAAANASSSTAGITTTSTGNGSSAAGGGVVVPPLPEVERNAVGTTLALASLILSLNFIHDLLIIFPGVGVFVEVVHRMIAVDVRKFVAFFALYMAAFVVAVQVLLSAGRTNDSRGVRDSYASFPQVMGILYSLFVLTAVGEEPDQIKWEGADATVAFLPIIAAIVYVVVIGLFIIVLLNLLIAMMGNTYNTTLHESTLLWRVNFARLVLRMELLAPCKRALFAGEREDRSDEDSGCCACGGRDKPPVLYYHKFRRVEGNREGGDTDIFADIDAVEDSDSDDDDAFSRASSRFGDPRNTSDDSRSAASRRTSQRSLLGEDSSSADGSWRNLRRSGTAGKGGGGGGGREKRSDRSGRIVLTGAEPAEPRRAFPGLVATVTSVNRAGTGLAGMAAATARMRAKSGHVAVTSSSKTAGSGEGEVLREMSSPPRDEPKRSFSGNV